MFIKTQVKDRLLQRFWGYFLCFFCPFLRGATQNRPTLLPLKTEVSARLEALRQFIPARVYTWELQWDTVGKKTYGRLLGFVDRQYHCIEICFNDNSRLFFDKNNPTWILYPNRLSFYPKEKWFIPLKENPGLNAYLLTMPFLSWPVVFCEKTAKFGRRAIKVCCRDGEIDAELYLDQTFNTLLYFILKSHSMNTCASFKLKHLKKFGRHWSPCNTEFRCNSFKTLLKVLSVNLQE